MVEPDRRSAGVGAMPDITEVAVPWVAVVVGVVLLVVAIVLASVAEAHSVLLG